MKRVLLTLIVCTALLAVASPTAAQETSGGSIIIEVDVYHENGTQIATVQFRDDVFRGNNSYGWSSNYRGVQTTNTGHMDNLVTNGTVEESFEGGDLSDYEGALSYYSVGSTATDGSNGLDSSSDGNNQWIVKTSDTAGGPEPGEPFSVQMRADATARQGFFFAANSSQVDGSGDEPDSYQLYLEEDNNAVRVVRGTHDGGVQTSDVESVNIEQNTWYTFDVSWSNPAYAVSGYVTDRGGDPIDGATVSFDDQFGTTATTNSSGYYSAQVGGGEHDATASASGYEDVTKTVTIDGSDVTRDFSLPVADRDLEIDTRLFLEHNTSAPYEVVYNDSGSREDVTDSATVTSGNTSIVTVDSGTQTINATSDTSVNDRTYVEAEYTTAGGETLRAQQNVTVANETVSNIEILPTWNRVGASVNDPTIETIIVATFIGVAAGIFASSFASIAAFVMVMTVGWLSGRVGDGMIIAVWMIGAFVGLNVALNINRRIK